MELSDEDLVPRQSVPFVEPTFVINHRTAQLHLQSLVDTYKQFDKFPHTHPSYAKLRRTGAIYQYILDHLKE